MSLEDALRSRLAERFNAAISRRRFTPPMGPFRVIRLHD